MELRIKASKKEGNVSFPGPFSVGLLTYFFLLFSGVISGCSPMESPPTAENAEGKLSVPSAQAEENGYRIVIQGDDQMRFDIIRFTVPPGVQLRVVLDIVGVMDRDSMGHNWVLVDRETPLEIFATDAAGAVDSEYIPVGWEESLLAYTPLLGGGESAEIVLTTPLETGEYPYLCTFPGHFYAGMRGVMVVSGE